MHTNISVDSKEIIDRYWAALVDCPVIHPVHGCGYIESYSNERFTILINEYIDGSSCSRTTIYFSEFNKSYGTWHVDCDEFREIESHLANNLYECVSCVHKHLCMSTRSPRRVVRSRPNVVSASTASASRR